MYGYIIDFDPYVSEKTTQELLFFAKNLLKENGTHSRAEQVLQIQLEELENKKINQSAKMHIFYIQKLYNSIVDIGNELDVSAEAINDKMQTEQKNEDARDFAKLSFFEKIKYYWILFVALAIVIYFAWFLFTT